MFAELFLAQSWVPRRKLRQENEPLSRVLYRDLSMGPQIDFWLAYLL